MSESLGGGLDELMKYGTLKNAAGQTVVVKDGVTYLDGVPQEPEDEEEGEWIEVGVATGEEWYGEDPEPTLNYSPSQKRDNRGRFGSGGAAGSSKSSKSETAKSSAVAVGKEIQNYAKANEASIAKKLGGVSFSDSEPVDVVVPNKAGVAQHGIEMKTMVKNGNFKLTMDGYAQARKVNWEKKNPGSTIHTLVLDDHAVFNAKGPGKHDYSKREYYYRRGVAGSARVSSLHKAKDLAEVEKLMKMDESQLPKGAKRSDSKMREGTWKPFTDAEGKGFKNKKTGKIVRAKKDSEE